jgi:hypothetical protein
VACSLLALARVIAGELGSGLAAFLRLRTGRGRRTGRDIGIYAGTDQALDESPGLVVEDCRLCRALF